MGTQEDYPTLTYRNVVDVSDIFGRLKYVPSMILDGVEEIEALAEALIEVRDIARVQVSLAEDLGYPVTAQVQDDGAGLVLYVQSTESARLQIVGGRHMKASDVPDIEGLYDQYVDDTDEVLTEREAHDPIAEATYSVAERVLLGIDVKDGTVGGFVPVKLQEEPGDVQVGDQVLVHDARALSAAHDRDVVEHPLRYIEAHGGFFSVENEAEEFVGGVTAISGPYDDDHGPMYCVDGDWWYYRWQLYPVVGEYHG